jgi:hypothetical protein
MICYISLDKTFVNLQNYELSMQSYLILSLIINSYDDNLFPDKTNRLSQTIYEAFILNEKEKEPNKLYHRFLTLVFHLEKSENSRLIAMNHQLAFHCCYGLLTNHLKSYLNNECMLDNEEKVINCL